MSKYVFNEANKPRYYPPVVKYNGVDIMSSENITTILGKKKSGKSLLVMDLVRACLTGKSELGFEVKKCPPNKKVYYIDTEMAKVEFYNRLVKLLKGVDPSNLVAININEMSEKERRIEVGSIRNAHVVFLDGIVDMLIDFNDIPESREVVSLMKRVSVYNSCPVASVLHLNPNDPDFITKGRGNLGTELSNKEMSSVIVKRKKGGVFEFKFPDMRNGVIYNRVMFEYDEDRLVKQYSETKDDVYESILSLLADNKVHSLSEIAEYTNKPTYSIQKALTKYDKVEKVSRGKYKIA